MVVRGQQRQRSASCQPVAVAGGWRQSHNITAKAVLPVPSPPWAQAEGKGAGGGFWGCGRVKGSGLVRSQVRMGGRPAAGPGRVGRGAYAPAELRPGRPAPAPAGSSPARLPACLALPAGVTGAGEGSPSSREPTRVQGAGGALGSGRGLTVCGRPGPATWAKPSETKPNAPVLSGLHLSLSSR